MIQLNAKYVRATKDNNICHFIRSSLMSASIQFWTVRHWSADRASKNVIYISLSWSNLHEFS